MPNIIINIPLQPEGRPKTTCKETWTPWMPEMFGWKEIHWTNMAVQSRQKTSDKSGDTLVRYTDADMK